MYLASIIGSSKTLPDLIPICPVLWGRSKVRPYPKPLSVLNTPLPRIRGQYHRIRLAARWHSNKPMSERMQWNTNDLNIRSIRARRSLRDFFRELRDL